MIPTFEAKSGYYGNIEVFLPEYGPRIIGDLKKDKREGKITVETDYKYEHVDSKPVVSVIAGEKPYFREKKECNGHNLTFKLKEYEEPIAVYLSCRGKIVDKRICRKKWEEFSIQRVLEKLPKNKEGIMLKAAITRHALEKAVKEKLKEDGITFDEKGDFYPLTKRLRDEGIIGQYEYETLKRNYGILNDPTHAKPSFNEDLVIKTISDSVSWLKSEIWEE